jgi:ribosomal protein L40E
VSVTTVAKYVCDLCGAKDDGAGSSFPPQGWVKIVVEDYYVERSFTDKHVCKKCAHEIAEAAK